MNKTLALAARPRAPFAISLVLALAACFAVFYAQAALICGITIDPLQALQAAIAPHEPAPMAVQRLAPAAPFFLVAKTTAERDRAVRCLTDAVYYEAASEPEEGQRAVAQVVLNRVRDPNFPKSVCGVVYEGWQRKTGCQFSFVCDGSIRRRPATPAVWDRMRTIAEQALNGYVVPEVGASTHYYATYVHPYWLSSVEAVAQVGKQIFCAWKGAAGRASALSAVYQGGEFDVSDVALEGGPPPAPKRAGADHSLRTAHGRVHLRIAAANAHDERA